MRSFWRLIISTSTLIFRPSLETSVHITWHGARINFGDLPQYLTYAVPCRTCTNIKNLDRDPCEVKAPICREKVMDPQLCLEDIVGVLDGGGDDEAAHRLQQDDHQHQGRVALHQSCTHTHTERLKLTDFFLRSKKFKQKGTILSFCMSDNGKRLLGTERL